VSERFDLIVVGGGLAGATAALAAAESGAKVLVCDAGHGASLHWSGMGHLFGPIAPPPAALGSLPTVASGGRKWGSNERVAALAQACPNHPFVQLGWGADEVQRRAERALRLLGLDATVQARALALPVTEGLLRSADVVPAGMMTTAQRSPTFVGFAAMPCCSATWLAAVWREAGLGEAASIEVATPQRWGGLLQAAAATASWDVEVWDGLLRAAPGDGALVLPPLLGATFERADSLRAALSARLGRPVLELAATTEPAWGLRLRAQLDLALAEAGVARAGALSDAAAPCATGWRVSSGPVEAEAPVLVLATGSSAWRGSAAVEERWTMPSGASVDVTAPQPWLPQGSGVRGIATDRRLAVLGERRLFACGGALAGHDAARDQTAFGLAVSTGIEAAKQALEEAAR
jgi:glycerol-3-phosphate dehydrogenase subunit B